MRKSTTRKGTNGKALIRCAIYTRKSSEDGLEQDFNSLDAQRNPAKPLSSVRSTRAGPRCPTCTMTAASPAAPLRDPP